MIKSYLDKGILPSNLLSTKPLMSNDEVKDEDHVFVYYISSLEDIDKWSKNAAAGLSVGSEREMDSKIIPEYIQKNIKDIEKKK